MKLPSIIKGWLNTDNRYVNQPEKLLADYLATNSSRSLDALVAYYHHDLYHYVLSLSDSMLADDIIQTTWLKVMNSAANYQPNTSLKSWLFSIARNTLIDELRRNNRWQWEEIGDVIESTLVSPEILCVQQEQLTMFNAAIEHLPFYQREAFIFQ